jgi:hypothetical protein
VDPTGRLAALMRTQVATLRRKQPGKQSIGRAAGNRAMEPEADFATLVAQRLKTVDPNDPRRAHKAVRIYLESVLLAELGSDLARDPAFALMVDDVHEQMSSDPQLAGMLVEAASVLLGGTS